MLLSKLQKWDGNRDKKPGFLHKRLPKRAIPSKQSCGTPLRRVAFVLPFQNPFSNLTFELTKKYVGLGKTMGLFPYSHIMWFIFYITLGSYYAVLYI